MIELLKVPVSLLPVLAFLGALILFDSYRLVAMRSLVKAIVLGCAAAGVALVINRSILEPGLVPLDTYSRFFAPLIEESLKAAYLVYRIREGKVGFLVDAAIYGFAVGTGFALVENLYYLMALGEAGVFLWIVRGFGTAVMHGSATAIFAILAKRFMDRRELSAPILFLPGLAAAVAIHTAYNLFILPPLLSTLVVLAVLPPVVVLIFERSERATRHWLGVGFDTDAALLEQITTGEIGESRIGRYLESLRGSFPPLVLADMLCLLQVHLELSIRAKGILLARQAGLDLPVDPETRAGLRELAHLEATIGPTGRRAVRPLLSTDRRDLWQIYMLEARR